MNLGLLFPKLQHTMNQCPFEASLQDGNQKILWPSFLRWRPAYHRRWEKLMLLKLKSSIASRVIFAPAVR